MLTREELLRIVGCEEKSSVRVEEICTRIVELSDAQLAYYFLFYYQKRLGESLPVTVVDCLVDLLCQERDVTEEASYCCLSLCYCVADVSISQRILLFAHTLDQPINKRKKWLPNALAACFSRLESGQYEMMRESVRPLFLKQDDETRAFLEFLLKTYYWY